MGILGDRTTLAQSDRVVREVPSLPGEPKDDPNVTVECWAASFWGKAGQTVPLFAQQSLHREEQEGGGCGHRTPKKGLCMAGFRGLFLESGAEPHGIARSQCTRREAKRRNSTLGRPP